MIQPFCKAKTEQAAEERSDANTGVKVSLAADLLQWLLIVTVNRVIESKFHESGEGNRAGRFDFSAKDVR
jgi:hypothetical protein